MVVMRDDFMCQGTFYNGGSGPCIGMIDDVGSIPSTYVNARRFFT